jgi:hypothetical protein
LTDQGDVSGNHWVFYDDKFWQMMTKFENGITKGYHFSSWGCGILFSDGFFFGVKIGLLSAISDFM